MKSSGIGGQAVIEGVMMRNKDTYAVAVRKPDNEIEVMKSEYKGIASRYSFCALPFIRGTFNLIDSMRLGTKILSFSADFYEEDEELSQDNDAEIKAKTASSNKKEAGKSQTSKEKKESIIMGVTMVFSVVLALALFMMLPVWLASFFSSVVKSTSITALLEGALRILIFIGYIALISQMQDIKRVFMYHGAEHKCINCIEHGLELTVDNVMKSSKQHKRCGTSFMFLVMIISVILFVFIRVDNLWLRMLTRVLLIPVVSGISYEFIRLAGNSDSPIVNFFSKPGLWMQNMTTREPDRDMAEVAIKSVEEVFDWRSYLEENFGVKAEAAESKTTPHTAAAINFTTNEIKESAVVIEEV